MLLAIDIGNTNLVFALFEGDAVRAQWRIRTDAHRSADEYAVWLFALMGRAGVNEKDIHDVIMASVVPDANFGVKSFVRQYLSLEPTPHHHR